MKKIVIGSVLALAAAVSFAGGVSVSAVSDRNTTQEGVRIETALPVVPGGLKASVTHVNDTYNRVAVGKDFAITSVGPVNLTATVAGVYQNTLAAGQNGYGLTVGAGASYAVTKNVGLNVGIERFYGQDRVQAFDGNVATIGLNVKF